MQLRYGFWEYTAYIKTVVEQYNGNEKVASSVKKDISTGKTSKK